MALKNITEIFNFESEINAVKMSIEIETKIENGKKKLLKQVTIRFSHFLLFFNAKIFSALLLFSVIQLILIAHLHMHEGRVFRAAGVCFQLSVSRLFNYLFCNTANKLLVLLYIFNSKMSTYYSKIHSYYFL